MDNEAVSGTKNFGVEFDNEEGSWIVFDMRFNAENIWPDPCNLSDSQETCESKELAEERAKELEEIWQKSGFEKYM